MKKLILVLIGTVFTITLIGCNTIKGIGKDLSSLGGGISNASEKVSDGLKKKEGE